MGQKINPIGLRLGINRTWDSRWFAGKQEYGKLLHEDVKIREILHKELKQAAASRSRARCAIEDRLRQAARCGETRGRERVVSACVWIGTRHEREGGARITLARTLRDGNSAPSACAVW